MPNIEQYKIFQKIATAIFILFCGVMIVVTIAAYSRPSGGTGLTMVQVQKVRLNAPCPGGH